MGLVLQVLHVLLGGRMGTQIADFCVNAALAEAAVRPVGVVGVAAQPGPELLHLQPHVAKFLLVDFHIATQLNDSKRNEKQLKRSNARQQCECNSDDNNNANSDACRQCCQFAGRKKAVSSGYRRKATRKL